MSSDGIDFVGEVPGLNQTLAETVVCFAGRISVNNGIWQSDNPLAQSLPIFIKQFTVLIVVSRVVIFCLHRSGIPSTALEIIGTMTVGPFVLGRFPSFREWVFPYSNIFTWETLANIGLLYHAFIVGLESDIRAITSPGIRATGLSIAGAVVPFFAGYGLYYLAGGKALQPVPVPHSKLYGLPFTAFHINRGAFYVGAAFVATGFGPVTELLARHKLLHSDVGKTAMTTAMITEMVGFFLLSIGLPMTLSLISVVSSVLCVMMLWVLCHRVLGPLLARLLEQKGETPEISEEHVVIAVMGMMLMGLLADLLGTHAVVGAYIIGQCIPDRLARMGLVDRLDDLIKGLFLPVFVGLALLKINPVCFRESVRIDSKTTRFVLVMFLTPLTKFASIFGLAAFQNQPLHESAMLGLISSSKSTLNLLLLHLGMETKWDSKEEAGFILAAMVAGLLLTMTILHFAVKELAKPNKKFLANACRSVEELKPDSELLILAPIYTAALDVAGLISVLELSNATNISPITVYAIRLHELTSHTPGNLFMQDLRKTAGRGRKRPSAYEDPNAEPQRDGDDEERIVEAFNRYEHENSTTTAVHILAATSPYATMHEDVCSLCYDKRIALILLPFHQQLKIEGTSETDDQFVRGVNQNILGEAPCSVGILIDRGLANPSPGDENNNDDSDHEKNEDEDEDDDDKFRDDGEERQKQKGKKKEKAAKGQHRLCVVFLGGPDDREALYYAMRMNRKPGTTLTVLRITLGDDSGDLELLGMPFKANPLLPHAQTEYERQKELDDVVIDEFRARTEGDESVTYLEKAANNGEDTIAALKGLEHNFDLYLVGKGDRLLSPLTIGLNDWSEWPELGAIGDILVTSSFSNHGSVLVMQQHLGTAPEIEHEGYKLLDGSDARDSAAVRHRRSSLRQRLSRYGGHVQEFY